MLCLNQIFSFSFFLQDKSVERVSKNWQMMGVNLTNWHKERIDAVLIGDANWRLRFKKKKEDKSCIIRPNGGMLIDNLFCSERRQRSLFFQHHSRSLLISPRLHISCKIPSDIIQLSLSSQRPRHFYYQLNHQLSKKISLNRSLILSN